MTIRIILNAVLATFFAAWVRGTAVDAGEIITLVDTIICYLAFFLTFQSMDKAGDR